MNTIECTKCGNVIEVDKALAGQIEGRVLAAAEHWQHASSSTPGLDAENQSSGTARLRRTGLANVDKKQT